MKNITQKIKKLVKTIGISYFYFLYQLKQRNANKKKQAYIFLKHNPFKRYLYLFIKFLSLEGYEIYLDGPLSLFWDIKNDEHAKHILDERLILIGKPAKTVKPEIMMDHENTSADYFSFITNTSLRQHCFYFPMTQHPLMYHFGWWNKSLEIAERKNSLFMAGNFNIEQYSRNENESLFGVISRGKIYNFLKDKKLILNIDDFSALKAFLKSSTDHKIILVNSLQGGVPMDQLRQVLSSFNFFFAMPGVSMPFCHNVVEAMSVGSIPFIQDRYAELFWPQLEDGKHVITYGSLLDLEEKIYYILNMSEAEILLFRQNVIDYYNNFLIPKSVIESIEKNNFPMAYIHSSGVSVELFKKRRQQVTALLAH